MHLLQIDKNSKILEIGHDIFKETIEFPKSPFRKRVGSFQYIDELGDTVIVDKKDGEYVIPTKHDIQTLSHVNASHFIDEEKTKMLLGV